MGEFSSQVCERSKMRALRTLLMKASVSPPSLAAASRPVRAMPAAAAPRLAMNARRSIWSFMVVSLSPHGKFRTVQRLALRAALHIEHAALLRVLRRDNLPGGRAVGDRVERHLSQVLVGGERLERLWVLALVCVVLAD